MEKKTFRRLGQHQEDIFTYYPDGSVQVKMDNILTSSGTVSWYSPT